MIKNILQEKKTSIIALLVALTTMCKSFGWIDEEVAGGLGVFIPELVNFIIIVYLSISKDPAK